MHPPEVPEDKIHKSLNASWKEGIAAAIMLGILDYYLIPYALFLGASARQIGWLVAFPNLFASIFQLAAVNVVKLFGSRLKFLVGGTAFQATLLVPAALLAFTPFQHRVAFLIFIIILYRSLGNLIGTAWGSLVSDYLTPQQRGNYLGWRARLTGMAGLGGIALAGVVLAVTKSYNIAFGFFLLYACAALARYISFFLMRKMTDLPIHETSDSQFTFFMFLKRFRESNFVKFVLYVACITFATQIAAPYFSVFVLKELNFNYLIYTALQLSGIITGLISFPIWGRHADLVGNAKILKITSFIIPAVPALWLISRQPVYLISVEALSGFIWGGFNLCATNFIYDAVVPHKRVRCLAYFNLINGFAICAGASLGGYLTGHLPPYRGSVYLTLFALSAGLRLLAHFFLSPNFREVRESARRISSRRLFFSVVGIKPLAGLAQEWNIYPQTNFKGISSLKKG